MISSVNLRDVQFGEDIKRKRKGSYRVSLIFIKIYFMMKIIKKIRPNPDSIVCFCRMFCDVIKQISKSCFHWFFFSYESRDEDMCFHASDRVIRYCCRLCLHGTCSVHVGDIEITFLIIIFQFFFHESNGVMLIAKLTTGRRIMI